MTSFDEIPHEILLKILSRLSVQHLLQLKSVCKAWLNIIRHQYFADMHVKHVSRYGDSKVLIMNMPDSSINSTVFRLLCKEWNLSSKVSFVIDPIHDSYDDYFSSSTFQSCCNGLLCFSKRLDCGRGDKVYVCNPLTTEAILLPLVTMPHTYATYGLGVDPATNTYKVVNSYTCFEKYFKAKVEVHTLGTNSWRKIDAEPIASLPGTPVFALGALHWIPNIACARLADSADIVSFDMGQEVFYSTPRPSARYFQLAVLKECLAMITTESNVEIWLLEGRGLQWNKTHSFTLISPSGKIYYTGGHVEIVGMWNNGEEIFFCYCRVYICYNIKTTVQQIIDLHIPSLKSDIEAVCFIGSLLSPSMLNRKRWVDFS